MEQVCGNFCPFSTTVLSFFYVLAKESFYSFLSQAVTR